MIGKSIKVKVKVFEIGLFVFYELYHGERRLVLIPNSIPCFILA